MAPPWQPLFDRLQKLRTNWPARAFSWDSRLVCITSSFTVEFESKARQAARDAFPVEYNALTITKATSPLRALAERTGGLRAGQLLLSAADAGPLVPFGLWWPWGDGMTTSFRFGLDGLDWNDDPYPKLRDLFAVAM